MGQHKEGTTHNLRPGSRVRVLLLAEQCNPDWPSLPVVGYNYAVSIAGLCDVVVATQVRNEPNIRMHRPEDDESLRFEFIDTEYIARPLHRLANVLRGNPEIAWSTNMAMAYLPYVEFERQVWKRFRGALRRHDFDIVHRITPMSPTLPSWIAGRGPQPFVLGPLNGNLAWPAAFAAEQKREREGLRKFRNVSKVLPFMRRTWRNADCVLAAFQHTVKDLTAVPSERIVMLPEVGYDDKIFYPPTHLAHEATDGGGEERNHAVNQALPESRTTLRFLFVGRLVPYKLAEVAVRAFAGSSVLRDAHYLHIVGDGPELSRLQQIARENDAGERVVFEGRQDQAGVAEFMRRSDVFVFPSIRELGAGVVVEAMACGMICLVVDYGGPSELVGPECGYKVPMATLDELVVSFRSKMEACASSAGDTARLAMRQAAIRHARENFRWQRKAELTHQIYHDLLAR